jgi:SHS2 domain-containing protein
VGRYRFIEDVAIADCAVELEGTDLSDLFETAASALVELMVDPATLPATTERTIALTAPALDLLLYDWLSELIYLKDRDGAVFPRTRVRVEGTGPFTLTALASGGTIDPASTALRSDAKAVTFHQFRLDRVDGGWLARVVIDI